MHRKFFTPYPLQKSTVYQSNSVSDILSDQFTHLKNTNWIYPLFRHFMQLYRAVFYDMKTLFHRENRPHNPFVYADHRIQCL